MNQLQSKSAWGPYSGVVLRRFTRRQYVKMFRAGFFGDRKVELIGGIVEETSPQFDLHAAGITLAAEAIQKAFGNEHWVRIQATLNLGPGHMPDPDISVVHGTPSQHARRTNQKSALLVVEVSDSTLDRDRDLKSSMYAATGITDFWIVNLVDTQLEVYRNPQVDPLRPFGSGYDPMVVLKPGQLVSPLALPTASIPVTEMFPS